MFCVECGEENAGSFCVSCGASQPTKVDDHVKVLPNQNFRSSPNAKNLKNLAIASFIMALLALIVFSSSHSNATSGVTALKATIETQTTALTSATSSRISAWAKWITCQGYSTYVCYLAFGGSSSTLKTNYDEAQAEEADLEKSLTELKKKLKTSQSDAQTFLILNVSIPLMFSLIGLALLATYRKEEKKQSHFYVEDLT